jgi:hypothetical protein
MPDTLIKVDLSQSAYENEMIHKLLASRYGMVATVPAYTLSPAKATCSANCRHGHDRIKNVFARPFLFVLGRK